MYRAGTDLAGVGEGAVTVVGGVAKGAVVDLVIARADPEDGAAAADRVDGVGHLGEQRRVAESHAEHQGAELDGLGAGRQGGNLRPAFPQPYRLPAVREPV